CNSVKIKSNCCSIIYIGKRDTPEILDCSAYLRDPVVPSISCSKDCANLTHSSAVVCIGKGNSQKRVDGSACLVDPRVSRVCCSKDRSIVTHGRSRVCITKGNVLQRKLVVPLVCAIQFDPPSVVLRIVPPSPTAVPLFASVNETP